jgi:Holliday junction resolvase RusA-like endonuclease
MPPKTGNHQHGRTRRGKTYVLPEVKDWHQHCGIAIPASAKRLLAEPIQVTYRMYRGKVPGRRPDIGNIEKMLDDMLERCGVVLDDRWIERRVESGWAFDDNG